MTATSLDPALQRLLDKSSIQEALHRYVRGVDRCDMDLVRSAYHEDAIDDHGEYKGSVSGFVEWLTQRHGHAEHSMHFLSNCHIEFFSDDVALAETYFASRRVANRAPEQRSRVTRQEVLFDEKLGRYIDRFERRNGYWRVAHRVVVFDVRFTTPVRLEPRVSPHHWAMRDSSDIYARMHGELAGQYGPPALGE